MSDALPAGWTSARIQQVVDDFQPGFASGEKNVEGGVAHLRMNNIGLDGELVLDLVRTVPEKLAKSRHDLRRGDVLVCTTNSAKLVGKCAFFDLPGRYAFSNHLTRLRPNDGLVDGRFLRWSLWLQWKSGAFDDQCKHWVNQSTLPKDALLESEMPLPPLAEQRRIVAKLETLLGKVDACQRRLANIPRLLQRFRQSVLAAACSGRLTADWRASHKSEGWRSVTISDVLIGSFYGPRFGAEDYSDEGVPTIRTTDMDFRGGIKLADSPRVKLSAEQLRHFGLQDGDLLVTRTGATIGKCALYVAAMGPAMPSAYLIRFRLNKTVIEPRFALTFLMSPLGQAQLLGGSTAVAQPNVNATAIAAFALELPPIDEQHEIVRRVEQLFTLSDQLEARFAKAQAHVDKLTQSLLAKAFRGELVPQDPNDEPASALLARIRSATNGAEKPARRKAKVLA